MHIKVEPCDLLSSQQSKDALFPCTFAQPHAHGSTIRSSCRRIQGGTQQNHGCPKNASAKLCLLAAHRVPHLMLEKFSLFGMPAALGEFGEVEVS